MKSRHRQKRERPTLSLTESGDHLPRGRRLEAGSGEGEERAEQVSPVTEEHHSG